MRLSEHFESKEFACQCCGAKGPQPDERVSPVLIEALEELRHLAGGKPVHIKSGYRCAARNAAVGGSPKSQHLQGMAADIRINGMDYVTLYHLAHCVLAFFNGGIGLYPKWVHVDVRGYKARW